MLLCLREMKLVRKERRVYRNSARQLVDVIIIIAVEKKTEDRVHVAA